jgi:guanine deaminase
MRRAIALSLANVRAGRGGPFGAVVTRGDEVIAEGTNRVTSAGDPTAHAEVEAIRAACARLGRFHLEGCEIYTSCEPCPMCLGAIYWARLDRIWFANRRDDAAEAGFSDADLYRELTLPLAGRSIPTERMLADEARAAIDEWLAKTDRIPY